MSRPKSFTQVGYKTADEAGMGNNYFSPPVSYDTGLASLNNYVDSILRNDSEGNRRLWF